MTYTVTFTEGQMQALSGLMDVGVKALGIRALLPDVVGIITAIEASEKRPDPPPVEEAQP